MPIARYLSTVLVLLLAATLSSTFAADLTKKWRVSFSAGVPPIGGFNSQAEIDSASANLLIVVNDCLDTSTCAVGDELVVEAYRDPRDQSSVFGTLEFQSMPTATLAVQYGVNKNFLFEGSIGYAQSDVGQVEISAQFLGDDPEDPFINPFNFTTHRIPAGELEIMPISLTAIGHFRPRATLDPYLGAGIGYWVVGFDIDPQLDQISRNMDASRGSQSVLTGLIQAGGQIASGGVQVDLEGASVDATDSFAWHLVGGAEFTFKKKWSAFVDVRWVDVSRSFAIGFNGGSELGSSVPNFTDFASSENANTIYGPVAIGRCTKDLAGDLNGQMISCSGGGLLDLGRVILVRDEDAAANVDCSDPSDVLTAGCVLDFVFEPDGELDPGAYYARGGTLDYDGLAVQFGIRFTFGN
jgi:opacity protein-like surface antigen